MLHDKRRVDWAATQAFIAPILCDGPIERIGPEWVCALTRTGHVDVTPLTTVPRRADGTIDAEAIHRALSPAILLDSRDGAGWSYVVPTDHRMVRDDGQRSELVTEAGPRDLGTDPFAALDDVCALIGVHPSMPADDDLPPFSGGLVGALAYDLGRRIEPVAGHAARDRGHPDVALWLTDVVIAIDPTGLDALVVFRDLLSTRSQVRQRRIEEIGARIAAAANNASAPATKAGEHRVTTSLSEDEYLAAIDTILEHIAAGNVFQVNLTQRLTARWQGTTAALYAAMAHASPAPMGACIDALGIASISPETFLSVDGGTITTQPIKGTRPRHGDPHLDAALADDLATSPKDRAENIMVVDMERNDLGRVCVPGSIHVPRLLEVEAHPTVWHLVSSVVGTLHADAGYGAILRATFPCGSVTGAPKVAAMQIIDRLEPVSRGWYCGAIGFLAQGQARLSVAIRTATLQGNGTVDYGAGGGIVADSDPYAELAECHDKAAAFLTAVGAQR